MRGSKERAGWFAGCAVLFLVGGCAELPVDGSDIGTLSRQSNSTPVRLAQSAQSGALSTTDATDPGAALVLIEELRSELEKLRDQFEVQKFELEKLRRRQRELYDDLDERLRREERLTSVMPQPPASGNAEITVKSSPGLSSGTAVQSVPQTPQTQSGKAADAALPDTIVVGTVPREIVTSQSASTQEGRRNTTQSVSISEEDAYDQAFDLLKESRYADAAVAFAQFIRRFPQSELNDDAWYWIGEARYVTREFDASMRAFETVVNHFTNSPRIPASHLKIGYIQYENGAYDDARKTLDYVLDAFPTHRVVVSAKARLKKMDREGR